MNHWSLIVAVIVTVNCWQAYFDGKWTQQAYGCMVVYSLFQGYNGHQHVHIYVYIYAQYVRDVSVRQCMSVSQRTICLTSAYLSMLLLPYGLLQRTRSLLESASHLAKSYRGSQSRAALTGWRWAISTVTKVYWIIIFGINTLAQT